MSLLETSFRVSLFIPLTLIRFLELIYLNLLSHFFCSWAFILFSGVALAVMNIFLPLFLSVELFQQDTFPEWDCGSKHTDILMTFSV